MSTERAGSLGNEGSHLADEAMGVHLSPDVEEVEELVAAGKQALADVVAGELGLFEHVDIEALTGQDTSGV